MESSCVSRRSLHQRLRLPVQGERQREVAQRVDQTQDPGEHLQAEVVDEVAAVL